MENPKAYYCFTRTWWRYNSGGPHLPRMPGAGRRHTVAKNLTWAEARSFCEQWNSSHNPGPLSRKCEFAVQSRHAKQD